MSPCPDSWYPLSQMTLSSLTLPCTSSVPVSLHSWSRPGPIPVRIPFPVSFSVPVTYSVWLPFPYSQSCIPFPVSVLVLPFAYFHFYTLSFVPTFPFPVPFPYSSYRISSPVPLFPFPIPVLSSYSSSHILSPVPLSVFPDPLYPYSQPRSRSGSQSRISSPIPGACPLLSDVTAIAPPPPALPWPGQPRAGPAHQSQRAIPPVICIAPPPRWPRPPPAVAASGRSFLPVPSQCSQ